MKKCQKTQSDILGVLKLKETQNKSKHFKEIRKMFNLPEEYNKKPFDIDLGYQDPVVSKAQIGKVLQELDRSYAIRVERMRNLQFNQT